MIPEELKYTAEHEWVRGGGGAEPVRVGITDYAQDALGDVVFVSLPEVGANVTAGEACGEVESTKSVSEVYAPISGEVISVQHRPGAFGSAELEAASEDNERNSVLIRTAEGADVIAVQIAGLVARRIVCDAKVGDKLTIGDTYGLIRFGSRLDTYLPAGSNILVSTGQRALAGETVLAELP